MNKIFLTVITAVLFLFTHFVSWSQSSAGVQTRIFKPDSLWITVNKTTSLIFPFAIKSVDRGSPDLLAQKAGSAQNILLVKAAKEAFPETNLSVITADGRLYSFLVNYRANPTALTILFSDDTISGAPGVVTLENNEALLQASSKKVAGEKRMLYGTKDRKDRMQFQLNGLYTKGDVLYFQFEAWNSSYLTYDIDAFRFFIKDKRKQKRTAVQEIELLPLYWLGDTSAIEGRSKNVWVAALPKFTLSNKKYLHVQLLEKGGGRSLALKVHNRTLVKARPVAR